MVGVCSRRRQQQAPARLQNAVQLGGGLEWVGDMFEYLRANDHIIGIRWNTRAVLKIGDDRDLRAWRNVDDIIALDRGRVEAMPEIRVAKLEKTTATFGAVAFQKMLERLRLITNSKAISGASSAGERRNRLRNATGSMTILSSVNTARRKFLASSRVPSIPISGNEGTLGTEGTAEEFQPQCISNKARHREQILRTNIPH